MSDDPDAKAGNRPKTARRRGLAGLLAVAGAFAAGAVAGGVGGAIGVNRFGGGGVHAAEAPAPSPIDYVEVENAFTSNLVDTGRYLQVRLTVSTTGGAAVRAAIVKHKPALVSTILSVLGELSEADVADRVGKDKLRLRLKGAINDVLRSKGEPVGIDEVFFTSLVIQ